MTFPKRLVERNCSVIPLLPAGVTGRANQGAPHSSAWPVLACWLHATVLTGWKPTPKRTCMLDGQRHCSQLFAWQLAGGSETRKTMRALTASTLTFSPTLAYLSRSRKGVPYGLSPVCAPLPSRPSTACVLLPHLGSDRCGVSFTPILNWRFFLFLQ